MDHYFNHVQADRYRPYRSLSSWIGVVYAEDNGPGGVRTGCRRKILDLIFLLLCFRGRKRNIIDGRQYAGQKSKYHITRCTKNTWNR